MASDHASIGPVLQTFLRRRAAMASNASRLLTTGDDDLGLLPVARLNAGAAIGSSRGQRVGRSHLGSTHSSTLEAACS
jgi:hypothetical protein